MSSITPSGGPPSPSGPHQQQEERVKKAAEIKEWLESRISELDQEVSRLRDMLSLVDETLRKMSFIPATELRASPSSPRELSNLRPQPQERSKLPSSQVPAEKKKSTQSQQPSEVATASSSSSSSSSSKQLRRSKDGMLLGNALVEPSKVVIVPEAGLKLSPAIPPFQSFFINRILKGYQSRDQELAKAGTLSEGDVLQYDVKESDGNISSVTVSHYRDPARLNEILSTATWAFARMLEKK